MTPTHPDLFPIPPSPSPRMVWLRANGIVTRRVEDERIYCWRASRGSQVAMGMTEDGALVALCAVLKIQMPASF